jgi:hypothetical protein
VFQHQHSCLSDQRVTSHSEGKIRNSRTCVSLWTISCSYM